MRSSQKVFCIGLNKTGTTSLNAFMQSNGYICAVQAEGELLIKEYAQNNWQPIIDFCKGANFFQDLPFSAPNTPYELLKHFPDALYILTERESAEQWYNSLCKFHRVYFGAAGLVPTADELKKAEYRYLGFAWDANRALYESPESDPYRKEDLIAHYRNHSHNVRALFEGKTNLLIINLADNNTVSKLSKFLGIQPVNPEMPWLNKTSSLNK